MWFGVSAQVTRDSSGVILNTGEMAQYPGGLQAMVRFLTTHLNLPAEDLGPGCVKFNLQFTVYENGSVHHATMSVRNKTQASWNAELQRVMSMMPAWKPATKNGQPVKCYFNLPWRVRYN